MSPNNNSSHERPTFLVLLRNDDIVRHSKEIRRQRRIKSLRVTDGMGSASASVNATGIGIGFGKTYTDDNCVMLKNSRELWNYGMKAAALQVMCADPANRKAILETYVPGGFLCHGDTPAKAEAQQQAGAAKAQPTAAADTQKESKIAELSRDSRANDNQWPLGDAN